MEVMRVVVIVVADLERQGNLNQQTHTVDISFEIWSVSIACADGRLWHRRAVWMSEERFCLRTSRSLPPPNANATASNCVNRWNR